jgi:hypothetical protein
MIRILSAVTAFYIALGAAIFVLWPTASWPQSTHDAPPTGAEIGRIVIVNLEQTQMYVRADHEFDHNGQKVSVTVHYMSTPNWGTEDSRDRITISVPDGYIAIPPEVTLPENDTVEVAIYEAIVG